jgi:hypothetical protein
VPAAVMVTVSATVADAVVATTPEAVIETVSVTVAVALDALDGAASTSTQSASPSELVPLAVELYVVPGVAAEVAQVFGSTQVAVYPATIFVSSMVMVDPCDM